MDLPMARLALRRKYHEAMESVITDIKPSTKKPGRASVMVDGKFAISLSYMKIDDMGLVIGMPWNETVAAKAVRSKAVEKATKAAMNRLNRRPMSRKQLRDKLIEKEHAADIVDEVLDKAIAAGALDDENPRDANRALYFAIRMAVGSDEFGKACHKPEGNTIYYKQYLEIENGKGKIEKFNAGVPGNLPSP